jgi:hypothetical protein
MGHDDEVRNGKHFREPADVQHLEVFSTGLEQGGSGRERQDRVDGGGNGKWTGECIAALHEQLQGEERKR